MFLRRSGKRQSYSPWVAVAIGAGAVVLGSILLLVAISSQLEYSMGRALVLVAGGLVVLVVGFILVIRGKRLDRQE